MQRHVLSLSLCVLLAACGGGDDAVPIPAPPVEPKVPGTEVPVVATQNAGAATTFARSAFAADVETLEPIEIGDVQFAVSDTEEPSE